MRVLVIVIALAAPVVFGHGRVLAQDPPADPSAWVARAQAAENAAAPVEALAAWRGLLESAPTSRLAGRARSRIAWIEARSEADYAPLAHLMRYLGLPLAARDESTVGAFETEVSAMPDGRVRPEGRLAVADDWARLGETERALAAWDAALDDPRLDPADRNLVRESMARARMDSGDLPGTLRELDDADLGGIALHRLAARRLRAQTWVPVSYGVLGAFVLLVLALVARSGRAAEVLRSLRDAPLRPIIALVVGLGPCLIVSWWGDDSSDAFVAYAPFSSAIVLLCFVAGEATERPGPRALVGLLAILAALAMAYVSVARHGEALPWA